jgi:hypothetical protein
MDDIVSDSGFMILEVVENSESPNYISYSEYSTYLYLPNKEIIRIF